MIAPPFPIVKNFNWQVSNSHFSQESPVRLSQLRSRQRMPDVSVTIFSIYMGIYCSAFGITSIYCAYFTMKNQSQQQQSIATSMIDSCFTWAAFIEWIKLTLRFKRLYLSIIPHIFDQATDITVIYEYYSLINDENIKNVIDTTYLFWMSIILFIFSRLISTIAIYKLTRKKFDILLGFFDLLMIRSIYVGYLLKRESPTNIQRYICLLEATLESFPQLLISTFFITTVVAYNDNSFQINPFIPISLIFSLYSLTARVASDDKSIFDAEWKALELKPKRLITCQCVNFGYVLRVLMRFMEISSRLILYVLLWINFGGLATGIILLIEFIYLLGLACYGGSIEIIGNMMYFVMASELDVLDPLVYFLRYRLLSSYIYLIMITLLSNENINVPNVPSHNQRYKETIDSQFGFGLLIYCWISHFIWPCVGTYIGLKFANRNIADRNSRSSSRQEHKCTTRSIKSMLDLRDGDGIVDLITFGVPVSLKSVTNVGELHACVLVYYSMLHAVDEDNMYILHENVRNKATQLMIKYGLDKKIHVESTIRCSYWNPGTVLSTNGSGYLILESDNIIIDYQIRLTRSGYFGNNNTYNNIKSQIENKELKGKLYHGYAYPHSIHTYQRGDGTLILYGKNTITMTNKAHVRVGNGNIFICCKKLIISDTHANRNTYVIEAVAENNCNIVGTIAIYCDELEGNNNDGVIEPKDFYRGSYQEGVNIMQQRK